jgi:hypothetical protein
MPQYSFGQAIPVTGPNNGFAGTVSRFGERVIDARTFVPYNAALNLNFGDPAVILPNATGGYYDSVADFVANATSNIGLVAQYFAGMAVREVKTQLTYGAGLAPGIQMVGYYANLQMAEVLERGSGTIVLSVGAPNAQAQVYTRVVANPAVPAGFVGDWETNPAASDLFTSVLPSGVINSATLTLNATLGAYIGSVVSGPGIAAGTYVVSGTGTPGAYTVVVLSNALTQTVTAGTPITFSNLVALPNVVAHTGFLDSNNILEITIKVRNAA